MKSPEKRIRTFPPSEWYIYIDGSHKSAAYCLECCYCRAKTGSCLFKGECQLWFLHYEVV